MHIPTHYLEKNPYIIRVCCRIVYRYKKYPENNLKKCVTNLALDCQLFKIIIEILIYIIYYIFGGHYEEKFTYYPRIMP